MKWYSKIYRCVRVEGDYGLMEAVEAVLIVQWGRKCIREVLTLRDTENACSHTYTQRKRDRRWTSFCLICSSSASSAPHPRQFRCAICVRSKSWVWGWGHRHWITKEGSNFVIIKRDRRKGEREIEYRTDIRWCLIYTVYIYIYAVQYILCVYSVRLYSAVESKRLNRRRGLDSSTHIYAEPLRTS